MNIKARKRYQQKNARTAEKKHLLEIKNASSVKLKKFVMFAENAIVEYLVQDAVSVLKLALDAEISSTRIFPVHVRV